MFLSDFSFETCFELWDQVLCGGIQVFFFVFLEVCSIVELHIFSENGTDFDQVLKQIICNHEEDILKTAFRNNSSDERRIFVEEISQKYF